MIFLTYITYIHSPCLVTPQQWKKTAEWIAVQEGISWHRNVWMHPREKGSLRDGQKRVKKGRAALSLCLWVKSRACSSNLCWCHGNSKDTQRKEQQQRQRVLCSVTCTCLTRCLALGQNNLPWWALLAVTLPAAGSCCFWIKRPGSGSVQILSDLQGRQATERKRGMPSLVSSVTRASKEDPDEIIVN